MHFFIFFAIVHCVFVFITPVGCFAQPLGIEKSSFLQHMFNEQPAQSSINNKKITNTEKKLTEISQDKVKSKKKPSTPITKLPMILYEGICQCGGKKLWNMALPKHVRKATIAGSVKFLDALSFIAGSAVLYTGYCTFLNKQKTLLKWYTAVYIFFSTFFNRSSTETIKNKPFSDDEELSASKEDNAGMSKYDKPYPIVSQTHPAFPNAYFRNT